MKNTKKKSLIQKKSTIKKSLIQKKNRNIFKRHPKKPTGGKALAAGGYGCVFKPALSCANKGKLLLTNTKKARHQETISKLMMKEDAFEEMEEIERVLNYIKKNPNNHKYFIVNDQVSVCTPAALTPADLNNYDKTCEKTKMGLIGINSKNINNNLEKLNSITMIDGGEDLQKVISSILLTPTIPMKDKIAIFKKINMKLSELLNKAIVPLNKDGLYHFDIKSANILLGKDGNTRLIDWGTSFEYPYAKNKSESENDNENIIPERVYNRAMIQYNVPFSNILFMEDLNAFIQTIFQKDELLKMQTKNERIGYLSKEIVIYALNESGFGHFEFILENLVICYQHVLKPTKKFTKDNAVQTLEDYISAVLMHYLDFSTLTFNFHDFFNKVFIHNLDIYGLLITYIDVIIPNYSFINNIHYIENNNNNKEYNKLITSIASLLDEFCWSTKYAATRIPLHTIIHKLNSI
jgi:hypothetical protein